MAVVDYKTSLAIPRTGVCSKWIASLNKSDVVEFTITKGTLTLPSESTPIIYIGPGTGIAPMRSILSSRIANGVRGDMLFFGARNRDADFFYQNEFEEYHREEKCMLFTAFSRDQDKKIYVQHRIKENAKEVWRVLGEKKGVVLLSGYVLLAINRQECETNAR